MKISVFWHVTRVIWKTVHNYMTSDPRR
jgi:hypothetical protein